MTNQVHTSRCRRNLWLTLMLLLLPAPSFGQQPCHDTLVYVYDSICEGDTYDFNGRIVNYTGVFFDTLPRVGTDCDSVIVLRLTALIYPDVVLYPRQKCHGNVGYDIIGTGLGNYYVWSASPPDTSLERQQYQPSIHVNPQQPTTYTLYVDYRPTPQCPGSGSVEVNPISPVVGAMHSWPDELTLDHMEFTVEDFSTGTREYHWGGWGGRHWYINGVRQNDHHECATFCAEPWWPDTVVVMMEGFTPTCLDTVIRKIPFKKVALYFPNAFTPGAESNNRFAPQLMGVLEFEMWIFDRYGTIIFHTPSADIPWDGTFEGTPCPTGTYVYRCRYRDIYTPEGYQSLNGTVTLIR
ncbi:MAG: gliding motility-associated C-terminal domain-containing protein [Bacteroidales bacterium]|nr:gliding motility-associated C-terminal domain-containing protein [Bacteroidales bacterium]